MKILTAFNSKCSDNDIVIEATNYVQKQMKISVLWIKNQY